MKSGNGSFSSSVENALLHLTENRTFAEIFHHGSLLLEIYAPRDVDLQQPHTRDEIYFVASGTGEYVNGETRRAFKPTDVLFVIYGAMLHLDEAGTIVGVTDAESCLAEYPRLLTEQGSAVPDRIATGGFMTYAALV